MKYYGPKPQKVSFPWGEMLCISLGESGRGRKLTYIPFVAPYEEETDYYQIGTTRTGGAKIIQGFPSSGVVAVLSGNGVYTRNTTGTVYVLSQDVNKIKVLAWGNGAWGEAGNIGTWYEFLVAINSFPCRFLVRPAGGIHKRDRYWLVFWEEGVDTVTPEEYPIYEKTDIPFNPNTKIDEENSQVVDLRDLTVFKNNL